MTFLYVIILVKWTQVESNIKVDAEDIFDVGLFLLLLQLYLIW